MSGHSKRPVLAVRVPVPLLGRIDAWSSAHQVTRSEAVRALIEAGFRVWEERLARDVLEARGYQRKGRARRRGEVSPIVDGEGSEGA